MKNAAATAISEEEGSRIRVYHCVTVKLTRGAKYHAGAPRLRLCSRAARFIIQWDALEVSLIGQAVDPGPLQYYRYRESNRRHNAYGRMPNRL